MNFRVVWKEKCHEIDESLRRSRSSIDKPEGVSVIRRFTKVALPLVFAAIGALPLHAQVAPGAVQPSQSSSSSSSSSAVSGPAAPQTSQNFQGSVPGQLVPGVLQISLQDAIDRGLKTNLGLLLSNQDIRATRGERWKQLSNLLPNLTTTSYINASQIDLAEYGFNSFPGVSIPSIVGPFAYFDSRAYVTQSMLDLKAINNTHAATQNVKATEYTYKDARDLVVLAVGYSYSAGDRRRFANRKRLRAGRYGAGAFQSGIRSGECGHVSEDRRPSRRSRIENAPAAAHSGEERLRHPEAHARPRDRPPSGAAVRADRQVAIRAVHRAERR